MDEITGTGPTQIAEVKNGMYRTFQVSPQDVGLGLCSPEALKGGDGVHNAQALRAVLEGAKNPYRDVACLNAAAGLIVAGVASDLNEAYAAACASVDTGKAKAALDRLIAVSQA
jgi:anthranilate phosphoribosyltransferase